MARMKFLCDAERCIECNGCVTACKQEHDVPWGVNRRRVVTINDGVPGERSISVACMHCSDAPCMAVCPVDCFYRTEDGVVLHDKDLCIGCGYCFYACPFGAPQFPQAGAFGVRGKMDKCTFCAGGPETNNSEAEYKKYGRNRLAEGKLPVCAEMCSTKALLAGDGDVIADIYRERVTTRGKGSEVWGWATAYGRPEAPKGATGARRAGAGRRSQIVIRRAFVALTGAALGVGARRLRRAPAGRSSTSRASTRASPTSRRTRRRRGTATSANGSSRLRTATRTRTNTSGSGDGREGGMVSRSIIAGGGRAASSRCRSRSASRRRSRRRSIPRRRTRPTPQQTQQHRPAAQQPAGVEGNPLRRAADHDACAAARPTC